MRINFYLAALLLIAGCAENDPIQMKWTFGLGDGWYPLETMGQPVYYMGEQIYINRSSLLVNCEGRGVRQGDLLSFLTIQNEVVFYNSSNKRMTEKHPSWLTLERENGRVIKEKESILVNLSLRGSGMENKSQCMTNQHQHRQIRL